MKLAQKILVVLMILAVIPAQAGKTNQALLIKKQYSYNTFGAREIADCKVAAKQIKLIALGNCEAADDMDQESADCNAARAIKSNDYSEKGCAAIKYLHKTNFEE